MGINAVKLLDDYKPRDQKILIYQRQLDFLEKTKISTAHFGDEQIGGTKRGIMDSYDEMMQKKEELKVLIASEQFKNLKVDVAIDALEHQDPMYAKLIRYRYLNNETLESIADKVGIHYTTVSRNMPKAVFALEEMLKIAML